VRLKILEILNIKNYKKNQFFQFIRETLRKEVTLGGILSVGGLFLIIISASLLSLVFLSHSSHASTGQKANAQGSGNVPPMGVNLYNIYGDQTAYVNQAALIGIADTMHTNGMQQAGYQYLNVDDSWISASRSASGHLIPNSAFSNLINPDPAVGLIAHVHNLGLKFGIYVGSGLQTCNGYGWPGSYGYEAIDAADFASWGVDYVKLDWCNGPTAIITNPQNNNGSSYVIYQKTFNSAGTISLGPTSDSGTANNMYSVFVTSAISGAQASPTGNVVVSNLTVNDGTNWQTISPMSVTAGLTQYNDQTNTQLTNFPILLQQNSTFIQTAASSSADTSSQYPTVANFTTSQPATVFIAIDSRLGIPSWMNDGTWTTTGSCDYFSRCFVQLESEKWKKLLAYYAALDGRPNPNDIVLSISASGASYPWSWAASDINAPTLWRTDRDIHAAWTSTGGSVMGDISYIIGKTGGNLQLSLPSLKNSYLSNGHWDDPDMLEIGVPQNNTFPGLNQDEAQSQFNLWSLFSSPLISGNDPRYMTNGLGGYDASKILLNTDVIAIDQQETVNLLPPQLMSTDSNGNQIWGRQLQNGDYAFVLLSASSSATQSITVNFNQMCWNNGANCLGGSGYYVKDLWTHLSDNTQHTSYTATNLPVHGSMMIRVSTSSFNGLQGTPTPTPTPAPIPVAISNLNVTDTTNASKWSIQNNNLAVGVVQFGDRAYTLTSVPSLLTNASWIKTANASKASTNNPLTSFSISQPSTVYMAIDNRITILPVWMNDGTWTNTGMTLVNNETPVKTFVLYSKVFPAGTISLGTINTTNDMYTVVVVGVITVPTPTPTMTLTPTPTPMIPTPTPTAIPTPTPTAIPTPTPTLGPVVLSGLNVTDTTNASKWTLQSNNLAVGAMQFGDRGYTLTSVPSSLVNASWIKAANASKSFTNNPLVSFSINKQATVYVGLDTRITTIPSWINDGTWVNTGLAITNNESPSRTFNLYAKIFSSGLVSLGPVNTTTDIYLVIVH
jgi:hypothetical protein